jgi:uncharacterized protein YybS (DUF2232 family)
MPPTRLPVNEPGKTVFFAGLAIAAIGAILWAFGGKAWFGRLPGDISLSKGNFQFYFPFFSCLLISVILTLLLWLFRR